MTQDDEKAAAARKSLEYIKDGMVVGLGSGSTATFVIKFLGEQVRQGLKIRGIPTSRASGELAGSLGIPLTSFDEVPYTDVTIDGADEVDPKLNLIKGGGGALTREKVIATASKKMVVVADSGKVVPALGKFPLPLEIIAFARTVIEKKIISLGATPKLRIKPDGSTFITDNGNQILDCSFGQIKDPAALARVLSDTPGIVEHGLFIGIAKQAFVGKGTSVEELNAAANLT